MADYNQDTALAIVSSGGYVDTLLGTIIPLVPIFAPYLALVLLFVNRVIPAILMLLATAFMSPVVIARPVALALPGQDWEPLDSGSPATSASECAYDDTSVRGPADRAAGRMRLTPGTDSVPWALAAFVILRFVLDVLNWSVQYIVVTQRRLLLTSGLTGRRVTVLPLVTLRDLAFVRSTGGRLLGYGAFTFEAGGQSNTVIDYIPFPEQMYLEIYHLLFRAEDGGTGGTGEDPADS